MPDFHDAAARVAHLIRLGQRMRQRAAAWRAYKDEELALIGQCDSGAALSAIHRLDHIAELPFFRIIPAAGGQAVRASELPSKVGEPLVVRQDPVHVVAEP